MRTSRWLFTVALMPVFTLHAQVVPPTAGVIASRAQAVHVDVSKVAQVTAANRSATFTPIADAELPPDAKALESGAVVGVLVVTGDGALAAGQYHVYLSKTTNGWEAVLERSGKTVTTSRDVTINTYPPQQIPRPMLKVSPVATGDDDQSSLFSFASYQPKVVSRDALAGSLSITVGGKTWSVTIKISW